MTKYKIFVLDDGRWAHLGDSDANTPERAVEKLLRQEGMAAPPANDHEDNKPQTYAVCPEKQWTEGPAEIQTKTETTVKFKSNRPVRRRSKQPELPVA